MSCCANHSGHNNKKKEERKPDDKPPKSFVGKYLYNLGKKDLEKEKHGAKHKGDCC